MFLPADFARSRRATTINRSVHTQIHR